VSNLSRAYRVNLTVLALVALFTGAFLVFSVLALSVAKRAQQFALLGVLGLTARERLRLVLAESAAAGPDRQPAGHRAGHRAGRAGAALLGGDLGGGYFPGVAPQLQWSTARGAAPTARWASWPHGGRLVPARAAQRACRWRRRSRAWARALPRATPPLAGLAALLAAGGRAGLLPPIGGIPLAAYLSVACCWWAASPPCPGCGGLLYDRLAPLVAQRLLPLLAVERARRVRESAAVAVSGVVAA
jgi:putative ABC transport system permease protein